MRYYLNVFNGLGMTQDEEGLELADIEAARNCAIDGIRSIIASEAKTGVIDLRGRIEILNEDQTLAAVVHFSDSFELLLGDRREHR